MNRSEVVTSRGASVAARPAPRSAGSSARLGRRPVQLVGGSRGSYGRTAFDVESGHSADRFARPRRGTSAYAASAASASVASGRVGSAGFGAERAGSGFDAPRERVASARAAVAGVATGRMGRAAAERGSDRLSSRERLASERGTTHERSAAKVSPVEVATEWVGSHRIFSGVVVVAVVLVLMLYPPAQAYYSAVRTNGVLASQLDDLNASNSTMQGQVDSLMTREGIEDEARRRGYVSEGDSAVDMSGVDDTNDPSSDTTVTQPSSSVSNPDNPWYVGVLDFIFRYDAASQGLS